MATMIGKDTLIRLLASRKGISIRDAQNFHDVYELIVSELLEQGSRVRFLDGHLRKVTVAATKRRAPSTGEMVDVPEKQKIVYRPSKHKEKVSE